MEVGVREQVIDGDQETEDGAQGDEQRERVGDDAVPGESRRVALEHVEADGACEQPDEERDQQGDQHQHGERLAA